MQTLNGLLTKADEEGRVPYLAILEYRNTPISGLQLVYSVSNADEQLDCFGPNCMPTKQSLGQPEVVQAHDELIRRQQRQTVYDKRASPLQKHNSHGDVVRVQRGNMWEPAVVRSAHVNPRSYLVQSQHGQLRWNRMHLSKTNELPSLFLPAVETASMNHPLTIHLYTLCWWSTILRYKCQQLHQNRLIHKRRWWHTTVLLGVVGS